eukprot:Hpha_TRINITY_DN15055_c6_g1::TRINITY_DN15055_c6_g1_i1::g.126273::m.126273
MMSLLANSRPPVPPSDVKPLSPSVPVTVGPLDMPPSPPLTTINHNAPRFEIQDFRGPITRTHHEDPYQGDEEEEEEEEEEQGLSQPSSTNISIPSNESLNSSEAQEEHQEGFALQTQEEQAEEEAQSQDIPPPLPPPPMQFQYCAPEFPTMSPRKPCQDDVPWNQRWSVELLRHERASTWECHCQDRRRKAMLGGHVEGLALVSSLVCEAWRLERKYLENRFGRAAARRRFKSPPPEPPCRSPRRMTSGSSSVTPAHQRELFAKLSIVDNKWRRIGATALNNVQADAQPYETVRRLANMFIFLEGKQLEQYTPDNPHLHARIAAQRRVIEEISQQEGSLFLGPDSPLHLNPASSEVR